MYFVSTFPYTGTKILICCSSHTSQTTVLKKHYSDDQPTVFFEDCYPFKFACLCFEAPTHMHYGFYTYAPSLQGIARQRAALVAGLRDSVKEFTDQSDVSSKDGEDFVVWSQTVFRYSANRVIKSVWRIDEKKEQVVSNTSLPIFPVASFICLLRFILPNFVTICQLQHVSLHCCVLYYIAFPLELPRTMFQVGWEGCRGRVCRQQPVLVYVL
jgi:hypothetical protein